MIYEQEITLGATFTRRRLLAGAALLLPAFFLGCSPQRVYNTRAEKSSHTVELPNGGGYLSVELKKTEQGRVDPSTGTLTIITEEGYFRATRPSTFVFEGDILFKEGFRLVQVLRPVTRHSLLAVTDLSLITQGKNDLWLSRAEEVDVFAEHTLEAHWTRWKIDEVALNGQRLARLSNDPKLVKL